MKRARMLSLCFRLGFLIKKMEHARMISPCNSLRCFWLCLQIEKKDHARKLSTLMDLINLVLSGKWKTDACSVSDITNNIESCVKSINALSTAYSKVLVSFSKLCVSSIIYMISSFMCAIESSDFALLTYVA